MEADSGGRLLVPDHDHEHEHGWASPHTRSHPYRNRMAVPHPHSPSLPPHSPSLPPQPPYLALELQGPEVPHPHQAVQANRHQQPIGAVRSHTHHRAAVRRRRSGGSRRGAAASPPAGCRLLLLLSCRCCCVCRLGPCVVGPPVQPGLHVVAVDAAAGAAHEAKVAAAAESHRGDGGGGLAVQLLRRGERCVGVMGGGGLHALSLRSEVVARYKGTQ